jgi:ABC-type metal ion transport system substrate-binding protein
MKKIIGLLSIALVVVAMACNDKPAEVKKEVIIVPVTTPPQETPAKSTTVTLDKNGVKVETKKVNVSVKNN